MIGLAAILRDLLAAGEAAVVVTLLEAKGSTPREAGTRMLVTARAVHGTVGGGRMEWDAVQRARALLGEAAAEALLEVPLGPSIGQCCGGHVRLHLARAGAAELAALEAEEARARVAQPLVLLCGAGHVGQALARTLALLPLRVRWLDSRAALIPAEPPAGIETLVTGRPLTAIEAAEPGSAYFVVTHSHALDFSLCEAVLRRGDFAYLGLIGSKSKRRQFERGWRELGLPEADLARLICPIGGRLRDKRPAVIAALATAELLEHLAAGADAGMAAASGAVA
jgi:xanthine dehydrogenase accessory protein XdhC